MPTSHARLVHISGRTGHAESDPHGGFIFMFFDDELLCHTVPLATVRLAPPEIGDIPDGI